MTSEDRRRSRSISLERRTSEVRMRDEDGQDYEEDRQDRRNERYEERREPDPRSHRGGGDDDERRGSYGGRRAGSQRHGFSLLIRNLDRNTHPDVIRGAFEQFGEVRDVYLPQDHYTRRARGFGFVEFLHEEDALNAINEMNDSELEGSRISVLKANEKRKTPDEMRFRDPRKRDDRGGERRDGPSRDRRMGGGSRRDYDDRGGDRYEESYHRGRERERGGGYEDRYSERRPVYRDEYSRGGGGGARGEYYNDRPSYRERSYSPRRY